MTVFTNAWARVAGAGQGRKLLRALEAPALPTATGNVYRLTYDSSSSGLLWVLAGTSTVTAT